MKTVRDYIEKIDDVRSIADSIDEVINWADNGEGQDKYPFDPFDLTQATIFLKEYIEMLEDTAVYKKVSG